MDPPTLGPERRETLDAWIASIVARSGLSTTDVRKGVRSLSSRYVERRGPPTRGGAADASAARLVAFASYYGTLHLLTAHAVMASRGKPFGAGVARILDLGAGSGGAGIGVALALEAAAGIEAMDRSSKSLAIAREGFGLFGLRGRTRRGSLPSALPRAGEGDLIVAGWVLNECSDDDRSASVGRLRESVQRGARLLVLEPLSGRVVPWWSGVAQELSAAGIADGMEKWEIPRPDWIETLDRASGLDHREIGARFLWGPVP